MSDEQHSSRPGADFGLGAPRRHSRSDEVPFGSGAPARSPQSQVKGPAVALLETESIARGFVVADALVKRATVKIAIAEAVTPGKFLLLFYGELAEVEEAFKAGVETAGASLLDKLLLPFAAKGLVYALNGTLDAQQGESLGIVETQTVSAAVLAADVALKRAEVFLTRLHLARGIGGKGYFTLSGDLNMVEAALEAVGRAVEAPLLLATELIQRPAAELKGTVL